MVAFTPFTSMEDAASKMEGRPPEELLRWAAERFEGTLVFATGFGVEGCVLVDIIARHGIAVDIFTLDTGLLFPETYALWRQLEARYGITIRGVRPDETVEQQEASQGAQLWARDPDACCQRRKVVPLRRALTGAQAWVTAIRRDQTAERASARAVEHDSRFNMVKINPLLTWSTRDVWRHVFQFNVPYNPLHDQGFPSIGCQPCTTAVVVGEDPRAGRWRGRAKTECGLHGAASLPVLQGGGQ